ncbi:MAG TPA: BPSS1780 family membrane protein [Luteimonas sp.]|nr:BPSS1780 family membrane protein [Luteimonas sp.]
MNEIRKVPASAGAEWVLGGFDLLRRSPLGLGLLGVIYGLLALLVASSAQLGTGVFILLELAMMIAGPMLVGGIAWAVRSVDQGGRAEPAHLLQGFRPDRAGRLVLTLLPSIGAVFVCMILLYAMVGGEALMQVASAVEKAGPSGQVDPSVFEGFPFGRFALWLLLSLLVGIVAGFFNFVAVPEIMFSDRGAFAAMGRSFRACVRNLPAFLVMLLLLVIAMIALYIAVLILGLVANVLAGQAAMQIVVQLLTTAVLMPVAMGMVYTAWKQMLGAAPAQAAAPVTGIEL